MNQHTRVSSSSRYNYLNEDFTDVLQTSKREKFLFEEAGEHRQSIKLVPTIISYRKAPVLKHDDFIMRITVDADAVTELRHLILRNCGDLVLFMRVKPVDHASKMKVWLCLRKSSVDTIISHIIRTLPKAEFGKITPLLPAAA